MKGLRLLWSPQTLSSKPKGAPRRPRVSFDSFDVVEIFWGCFVIFAVGFRLNRDFSGLAFRVAEPVQN